MTRHIAGLLMAAILLPSAARAASNINDTNRYAYGANAGWIDWLGDITNGANIGWIGLSNLYAYVQADSLDTGRDTDGDGMSYLRLSGIDESGSTNVDLTWESTPTRMYAIEKAASPTGATAWVDSGEGVMAPDPGNQTTRTITDGPATTRVYRVRAVVPLAP